jgi:hypothetical protein
MIDNHAQMETVDDPTSTMQESAVQGQEHEHDHETSEYFVFFPSLILYLLNICEALKVSKNLYLCSLVYWLVGFILCVVSVL